MKSLKESFRLPETPILAIVGSGGKTSLLFRLAREYPPRVVISNTAHIGVDQSRNADKVFPICSQKEIDQILDSNLQGVLLITGLPDAKGRFKGLDDQLINYLINLCEENNIPLLIEADGCRGKPLKAPAPWEPPVPQNIHQVIVCVGANGLEKPLNEDWVYRSEDYCQLAGLPMGEIISPASIVNVLIHPLGGMKNIPEGAKKFLLINQADQLEQQELSGEIALKTLTHFQRVVVASLNGVDFSKKTEIHRVYSPVGGIVLAAGESRRFGFPKILLKFGAETLLHRVARIALEGNLHPVVVVLGAYPEAKQEIRDLNLLVIDNPNWQFGQSTSVKKALENMPEHIEAVIFILGDQPFITPTLLQSLQHEFALTNAPVIAPIVNGQRANPVLFSRVTFSDLMEITGDIGGRQIFGKYPLHFMTWNEEKLLIDVDTVEDWEKLNKK